MRSYWPLLFLLASIWGARTSSSVAVDDLPPAALTFLRLFVAAVLLAGYTSHRLGTRRALEELRAAWLPCVVLGVINAAPDDLVAWGQTHIDSSIAAIAQASVPIFVVLLSVRFLPHEPIGPSGSSVSRSGSGSRPHRRPEPGGRLVGGGRDARGRRLVTLVRVRRRVRGASRPPSTGVGTGHRIDAGRRPRAAPVRGRRPADARPGTTALAALLALALPPTFVGQLLLFRMLRLYGSPRLSLVTYLMPGFAVVYGVVLLGEPLTAAALGGSR